MKTVDMRALLLPAAALMNVAALSATSATAQINSPQTSGGITKYLVCDATYMKKSDDYSYGGNTIIGITGILTVDHADAEGLKNFNDSFFNYVTNKYPNLNIRDSNTSCQSFDTESAAEEWKGNFKDTEIIADWQPPQSIPQSGIKTISLDFQRGDRSGQGSAYRGYRSASIKVNYRFLLCANEIQIAYSLDRKSLEHSQDYVDRFDGINPKYVVPSSEPRVPDTIPLDVKINFGFPPRFVARLEDGTAGEALGMGCFSGQTRKIGLVGALVGPKATMPQIKAYLKQLTVDLKYVGQDFGYPLLNPDEPVPAGAPPVRSRSARAAAPQPAGEIGASRPSPIDDTPGTTAANVDAAATAKAQLDKIIADKAAYRASVEAYRASVAKNKADYEAKMVLYRQQVAEQSARNEEVRRVNEARAALYRACVAGDRAACQRYKAQ